MKKIIVMLVPFIAVLFIVSKINIMPVQIAEAQSCKILNANCDNASDHSCCSGLTCRQGISGEPSTSSWKCRSNPTSTPTRTPTPTATRTPTPTKTPTPTPQKEWCHHHDRSGCDEEYVTHCDHDWSEGRCPTPSPTLTPSDDCKGDCIEVSITPTQPAPTEAPKCHGESYTGDFCGFSPEVSPNRKVEPPKCSVSLPKKPTLRYSRKSNTVVGLTWEENDENTTHWSVSYGLTKDNLPYGVPFLPKDARSIEINGLSASNWWFELTRWNGNECAVYSDRIDP